MTDSRIFGPNHLKALNRIGAIMLPRTDEFPAFDELGCIEHIDMIAEHAPKEDIESLKGVLAILAMLPTFMLKGFLAVLRWGQNAFEPLGSLFRLLDTGLRSIIITLYYSGKHGKNYTGPTPLDLIGFEVNAVPTSEKDPNPAAV